MGYRVAAAVLATFLVGSASALAAPRTDSRTNAPLRPTAATLTDVTAWTAPGTPPLSDAAAAALVTPIPEARAANGAANDYVPTDAQLAAFHAARDQAGRTTLQDNPLTRYVTGRPGLIDPTTDELIQWVSHKWGIPTDVVRAQISVESWWRQSQLGDQSSVASDTAARYPAAAQAGGNGQVFQSLGIAQVKWVPDGSVGAGTDPLRWMSTAFNLDYYAASIRYYYDGDCDWCGSGYGPGQAWNSVGAWYSPTPWGSGAARSYIKSVQDNLAARVWARASF
jgi:hypothetical protein